MTQSAEATADPTPASSLIGEAAGAFKRARLAAGLTQDQVADALKITRERVIRLESGKLDDLPPLIYVKGYVREFERILGLERQSIEQLFVRASDAQAKHSGKNAASPVQNTIYTSPGQRVSILLRAHPGRVLTAILLIALAGIAFASWWAFAG